MITLANTPANPEDAFLREVDEEFRRSQLMGLWQRYGRIGIAALVLALAALAAWLFWQDQKEKAAGAADPAWGRASSKENVLAIYLPVTNCVPSQVAGPLAVL